MYLTPSCFVTNDQNQNTPNGVKQACCLAAAGLFRDSEVVNNHARRCLLTRDPAAAPRILPNVQNQTWPNLSFEMLEARKPTMPIVAECDRC